MSKKNRGARPESFDNMFVEQDELTQLARMHGNKEFMKMWNACKPKGSPFSPGTIVIYGTGGQIPNPPVIDPFFKNRIADE